MAAAIPAVVMTVQKWLLSADDYFSALSEMRTDDLGGELGWAT